LMETQHSPLALAGWLGCIASGLLVVIAWLALLALMTSSVLEWQAWPYVAGPVALWVLVLALPALLAARRGALATLNALAMTAEAWLARAGYSVDLNQDARIGFYQPQITPVQIEEKRPIPLTTIKGQALLLASDQPAAAPLAEQAQEQEQDPPPVTRQIWSLPNGARVEQAALEDFSDRLSLVGWDRGEWVKAGRFDREQYDGLMLMLDQGGIIEGRKKGSKGKLVVKRADQRRRVLGLPLNNPALPRL
jgi:hypothetical protein